MAGPILRLKDLIAHTGLSRSAIYDRMDKKSPRYSEDFPKSFPLGGGAIGWFKSEIETWLETCATNAKSGALSKKSRPFADSKNSATQAQSRRSELHNSSEPVRKSSQQPASAPNRPTSQAQPKRTSRSGNLAEAIVEGGKINTRLLDFLQLKTWTPAMAALLISGIDPPLNCNEIPDGGIGLDEEPLHGSNARFHEARRILKEWHEWADEQKDQLPEVEPFRFFFWCIDETIDTEWLHLFMELAGINEENKVDLTSARFARLTNK